MPGDTSITSPHRPMRRSSARVQPAKAGRSASCRYRSLRGRRLATERSARRTREPWGATVVSVVGAESWPATMSRPEATSSFVVNTPAPIASSANTLLARALVNAPT